MTDFNHKTASEQIARIYGVDVKSYECVGLNVADQPMLNHIYITQNLGALMSLAIRNGIGVVPDNFRVEAFGTDIDPAKEYLADHSNDPEAALCVAFAKALIEKGGG